MRRALLRSLASLRSLPRLAPLALGGLLLLGGCQEEGYITLFDEDGTWTLVATDIAGSGTFATIDSDRRRDQFLLRFHRTSGEGQVPGGKMAAASCIDETGDQSPLTSTCNRGFTCRCFDYTFNEATMVFAEYAAEGSSLYTPMDGEPSPEDLVTIFLEESESAVTYVFQPLPQRLFDSDIAAGSSYRLQQKAASLFDMTACADPCGLEL